MDFLEGGEIKMTERTEQRVHKYNLTVGPGLPRDLGIRQVLARLDERGYPATFQRGEMFDWEYETPRELDEDTIKALEGIPGVKVRKQVERSPMRGVLYPVSHLGHNIPQTF